MPRARTPSIHRPTGTDEPQPGLHRRPNPVLVAGVVSLTLTLLAGWWFVLRPPERSEVALCASLTRLDGLDERLATSPGELEADLTLLSRAVKVAPPEISQDVEALARAVATVHDEASRSDASQDPAPLPGPPGQVADAETSALRAGMERIEPSADSLSGSSQRVVSWAGEHCGLTLGGDSAAGAGTGAPNQDEVGA